jgi:predicted CopG family antitoxin
MVYWIYINYTPSIVIYMPKSTILIEKDTRKQLKLLGMKGQSYDEVIQNLIQLQRKEKSA